MQLISCGVSGEVPQSQAKTWTQLDLDPFWVETIQVLNPNSQPRPVQIEALQKHRILESRRHLVIAAPTNSGKSLLGLLVLLESVRLHRRVVLIEPLRALAQEKTDELKRFLPQLSQLLGFPLKVTISTGDYRLEDELLVVI